MSQPDYAATFALLDADSDGLISAAEFQQLMNAMGDSVSDEQAQYAMQVMDGDGDGRVSLDELAGYLAAPPQNG